MPADTRRIWPQPGPGFAWGHWCALAEKCGAKFPLTRGFLLGIRNVEPFSNQDHPLEIAPKYNDTGVLLFGDGRTAPAVFRMATHAYQKNSRASPDVDGDGKGDVATIKPGAYVAHLRPGKYPVFEVTMPDGGKRLPCSRDLTHSGKPEGDFEADSILIHWGYNAAADSDHSSSIGCVTLDLPELKLLKSEAERHGGSIDFQLTTASTLVTLASELPSWDDETEPQA